jgi:hypothetical protein
MTTKMKKQNKQVGCKRESKRERERVTLRIIGYRVHILTVQKGK